MTGLKATFVAATSGIALLVSACEDRSKSILDRDEGTVEETREAVDRAADDVKKDAED